MNAQEWIDRFCDSPRRWLIVTAVTLVVALATVLPQVDQYQALIAEEEEQRTQLAEVERSADYLPKLRQRVNQTDEQLAALEAKTLTQEGVAEFRNELVNLVRESGCQVRRIGVGAVRTRKWHEKDYPLAEPRGNVGAETPFSLETRPVNLSVTGSMNEVRDLVGRVEKSGMMLHTRAIDLRPTGRDNHIVQVELELWCFALVRGGKA